MIDNVGPSSNAFDYANYIGAMFVDDASGEGMMVGEGGAMTPVTPEVVNQTLEAAGLKIVDGKIVGTIDGFEVSAANANGGLSLGAPPPLPALNGTAPASEVLSSTQMLQFAQSIQDSSILMAAILVLLRGAEEDRATNDKLGNVMFQMKDTAKQGQIGATKAKMEADLKAAREQYRNAVISGVVQIAVCAASAASFGAASAVAAGISVAGAVANAAVSIGTAAQQKESAEKGAVRQSGEADKRVSEFKQMEESAQAVIDLAKESGDACRDMWKAALKLISAMAQRSTQNVQAFTRI